MGIEFSLGRVVAAFPDFQLQRKCFPTLLPTYIDLHVECGRFRERERMGICGSKQKGIKGCIRKRTRRRVTKRKISSQVLNLVDQSYPLDPTCFSNSPFQGTAWNRSPLSLSLDTILTIGFVNHLRLGFDCFLMVLFSENNKIWWGIERIELTFSLFFFFFITTRTSSNSGVLQLTTRQTSTGPKVWNGWPSWIRTCDLLGQAL